MEKLKSKYLQRSMIASGTYNPTIIFVGPQDAGSANAVNPYIKCVISFESGYTTQHAAASLYVYIYSRCLPCSRGSHTSVIYDI